MDKEKWQEISRIFNIALEKRSVERVGFLNEACRDNFELREEIEILLAANDEKDSFIDSPKAALTENIAQTNLKKDQKIGEFQIIEKKIGAGGMGEVYKAFDMRLNRRVALKFLLWRNRSKTITPPAELVARSASRRRARTSEYLHDSRHRTIGRTYDFIVMQYVEGNTLADKIKSGDLPLQAARFYNSCPRSRRSA